MMDYVLFLFDFEQPRVVLAPERDYKGKLYKSINLRTTVIVLPSWLGS